MPATTVSDPLRSDIRATTHADEAECVERLLHSAREHLDPAARKRIEARSRDLITQCREASDDAGTLDAFLQEFGLSNREGVALMCLAEALLRVPDDDTADRLIAEKIRSGNWDAHAGRSRSNFVNASVWGLMLTGRLVTLDPATYADTGAWMRRLVSRLGEPVVRTAVLQAMRILGGQYVLGRSVAEALERGRELNDPGTLFSFDMLGEGARTHADADRYFAAYRDAIDAIGRQESAQDPILANGVSIKLSALHPRYEYAQWHRVLDELLPRLKQLAIRARRHGLGLSIDAEEAARLEPSLDLFERLALDPVLRGWQGLGFVLQAYQKRAPAVVDWLVDLTRRADRQIMVRLVKGAYWDTEIKHAQEQGFTDYPVYTRKPNTDLCYEVCAARLLQQDRIFPQFATHNANTVSTIIELAGARRDFEFQRLHGMGQLLYRKLFDSQALTAKAGDAARADQATPYALRVYAPVGSHRDLLPYLVRRLLENGANSSFVNRFLDARVPIDELARDVTGRINRRRGLRHPQIPVPLRLYRHKGEARDNAAGIDLEDPAAAGALLQSLAAHAHQQTHAGPIVNGIGLSRNLSEAGTLGESGTSDKTDTSDESGTSDKAGTSKGAVLVRNPSDRSQIVGTLVEASSSDVDDALSWASRSQPDWDALGGNARARILERAATLLESRRPAFMALIIREAGRTIPDALSEVREAIDFCRYYAAQARELFTEPVRLPGPTGERSELSLCGRGTFVCISPWNFPLAIFTGQIAAALAAGSCVIAKPAEQTPLVAAAMVRLFLEAGVPPAVLHLLPGDGGRLGARLLVDPRIGGVAFTGSLTTARIIQRSLADRPGPILPLIAETGGVNVMLVDSTALPEQVVDDVIASAFQSAGQRCSALRVLYLQEEIAEGVLTMLKGAMAALVIGDPLELATDIGPVIDEDARVELARHVEHLRTTATPVAECVLPEHCARGSYLAPCVFEVETLSDLPGEVFGPILHVIRYSSRDLGRVLEDIRSSGFGLTLGVHSRIDGFAEEIFAHTRIGNTYVNRNMIGAVVGVHPFGGMGLSGTGPKAGGPNYLKAFASERTRTENLSAKGGNTELFGLGD